jgi:DNA polymerase-3 subunit gamma/tau
MSPELVQLPASRVAELTEYAREMGLQRIVRVMETLGTTMVEMRHAPDARLLLEVAVVQLSSPVLDDSNENLLARVSQLEEAVKALRESGVAAARPQAPVNPTTGRAKVGGHAGGTSSGSTGEIQRPSPTAEVAVEPADATPVATPQPVSQPEPVSETPGADPAQVWPQITEAMRGLAKAMFKPAVVESVDGKKIVIRLPNNTPMKRAQEQVPTVVAALKQVCGITYSVTLVQADATGGIQRPVIAEEPEVKTIDKLVEEDPYAEIDMSETVAATDAADPMLAALLDTFPEGAVIDENREK